MYTEKTTAAAAALETAAVMEVAAPQMTAPTMPAGCGTMDGSLPGKCAPLAFPYVPMQGKNPERYSQKDALQNGTLFPGLNLPFHAQMSARVPAGNAALIELMALDFAIDELGLYLVTHSDDQEALNLYWSYIKLANEGRAKYEKMYGPLLQTDITEDGYTWIKNPWPWEEGGNV